MLGLDILLQLLHLIQHMFHLHLHLGSGGTHAALLSVVSLLLGDPLFSHLEHLRLQRRHRGLYCHQLLRLGLHQLLQTLDLFAVLFSFVAFGLHHELPLELLLLVQDTHTILLDLLEGPMFTLQPQLELLDACILLPQFELVGLHHDG